MIHNVWLFLTAFKIYICQFGKQFLFVTKFYLFVIVLICISLIKYLPFEDVKGRGEMHRKEIEMRNRKDLLGWSRKKKDKWCSLMEFAVLFQPFLLASSKLFGLFEIMAIPLKFTSFWQQLLRYLAEGRVAQACTATKRRSTPEKSSVRLCWKAVRSQLCGPGALESCVLMFEPCLVSAQKNWSW